MSRPRIAILARFAENTSATRYTAVITARRLAEGVWAAGDCTNAKFHQNNIAAGDAVKAAEDIYLFLKRS